MYLDALTLVSDAQALTATAFSTNTIDLGATTPVSAIGSGEAVGFAIAVDVAAVGTGTYDVEVVQSANANLSSPDVLSSRRIAPADLAAGAVHFLEIPMGTPTKRYLGLRYTLGGTSPGATVTAWATPRQLFSVQARYYARGYVV